MPTYQFLCPNGHEFEKIVPAQGGLYKWCKQCNELTQWSKDGAHHSPNYKELVCQKCGQSNYTHSVDRKADKCSTRDLPKKESSVVETAECPVCQLLGEHILKVDRRGKKEDIAHSSIRFQFNYLEPND